MWIFVLYRLEFPSISYLCRNYCFKILYCCSEMVMAIYKRPLGSLDCASRLVLLSLMLLLRMKRLQNIRFQFLLKQPMVLKY